MGQENWILEYFQLTPSLYAHIITLYFFLLVLI